MKDSNMSPLLVVGSVAFDTLHNSLGTHNQVVGGSATYASVAASFFATPRLVGVVGQDFPDEAVEKLRARGVELDGLEVADGKTFHWEGRYTDDLTSRETLKTELGCFADFSPVIPEAWRSTPYVLLGNIHPALQLSVLDQIEQPKLVVADTMNFWIDGELETLKKMIARVDILVINEEEARQLSQKHHLIQVISELLKLGPKTLVIKQGEYGAVLFHEDELFIVPGYPLAAVDPTGAGDTFVGGFLGYLAQRDEPLSRASLRAAVVRGSALASRCVEGIGGRKMHELTREAIDQRVAEFARLVDVCG